MAAQGRDVKLDPQRIAGYRNFGTKLWNATRFAEMNGAVHGKALSARDVQLPLNRWILTELARTVSSVDEALAAYRFNDASGALYRFVWNTYCDWYLELAKPVFMANDPQAQQETRLVTGYVLDRIYALLHPFMPFLTEELWSVTAPKDGGRPALLCLSEWPRDEFTDEASAADINWLIDLVTEIRSVRAQMNVPPAAEVRLLALGADEATCEKLVRHEASLRRLARLSDIENGAQAPDNAAQIVSAGVAYALPLEGIIDIAAEKARLAKAIAKLEDEISRIDKKLQNERFVANAPEEVVEQEREKRSAYEQERDALAQAAQSIG